MIRPALLLMLLFALRTSAEGSNPDMTNTSKGLENLENPLNHKLCFNKNPDYAECKWINSPCAAHHCNMALGSNNWLDECNAHSGSCCCRGKASAERYCQSVNYHCQEVKHIAFSCHAHHCNLALGSNNWLDECNARDDVGSCCARGCAR